MSQQEVIHISTGPAELADASRALRKQRKRLRAILRLKTKVSKERALVPEEKAKARGEAKTREKIAHLQRLINPQPAQRSAAVPVAVPSKLATQDQKKKPKPTGVTVVSSSFDSTSLAYILSGKGTKPKPLAPVPGPEPELAPEPELELEPEPELEAEPELQNRR